MANNPAKFADMDGRDPVSELWGDAVKGSEMITSQIHQAAEAAGKWTADRAGREATIMQNAGHPWLAEGRRLSGAIAATVISTTIEAVGQTLAAGPNAVLALQHGGESIGTGLGRIFYGQESGDVVLGVLEVLSGAGSGAQAALTFLPAASVSSNAKMAAAIRELNKEPVTVYRLVPFEELSAEIPAGKYVTTASELVGKPLPEVGGRLDVLVPPGVPGKPLAARYVNDPVGNVLVEAQTTYGNLEIPKPDPSEVGPWRSSMPSTPGLTGTTSGAPVAEFKLKKPVEIGVQPTRPVLKLRAASP
jgi:hypothetical protein